MQLYRTLLPIMFDEVRLGHSRQIEVGWIWPYVFGTLVSTEADVWMPD